MTRYARQKSLHNWDMMLRCTYGLFVLLVGLIFHQWEVLSGLHFSKHASGMEAKFPSPPIAAEMLTINTTQAGRCSQVPLSIEVTTGEHWLHVSKLFFLTIRAAPQLVIWSEDRHGRFLETLFITRKMGQQRWGQDADPSQVLYWEALPYWMLRRHQQGYSCPTRQHPMPDAVTGATPKTDFRVSTCVSSREDHIVVFLEVNMSLDFNEVYSSTAGEGTTTYNKHSGQPALIYRAEVDLEQPGRYEMSLSGHAHPAGVNGQIFSDLRGMTTALHMIEQAVVIVGAADEIEGKS